MRLKIEQEKKEEIDRLKTQYTFKASIPSPSTFPQSSYSSLISIHSSVQQHELETSGRGSPWTARSRKISRQAPPTPVRMPTQMRRWNPLGIDRSGEPNSSEAAAPTSSQGAKPSPRQKGAEPPASLPGFVNAFDSPPLSSQSARARAKQREEAEEAERNFFAPIQPSPLQQFSTPIRMFQSPPSPPSSPLGQKVARRNAAKNGNGGGGSGGGGGGVCKGNGYGGNLFSPKRASPRRPATQSPVQTQLYDETPDVEMPDSQEEEAEEEEAEAEAEEEDEVVEVFDEVDWAGEVCLFSLFTSLSRTHTECPLDRYTGSSSPTAAPPLRSPPCNSSWARPSPATLPQSTARPTPA